ncbi:MAG: hypothetical protein RL701_7450, partial [Pseudomonadota bacterium]
ESAVIEAGLAVTNGVGGPRWGTPRSYSGNALAAAPHGVANGSHTPLVAMSVASWPSLSYWRRPFAQRGWLSSAAVIVAATGCLSLGMWGASHAHDVFGTRSFARGVRPEEHLVHPSQVVTTSQSDNSANSANLEPLNNTAPLDPDQILAAASPRDATLAAATSAAHGYGTRANVALPNGASGTTTSMNAATAAPLAPLEPDDTASARTAGKAARAGTGSAHAALGKKAADVDDLAPPTQATNEHIATVLSPDEFGVGMELSPEPATPTTLAANKRANAANVEARVTEAPAPVVVALATNTRAPVSAAGGASERRELLGFADGTVKTSESGSLHQLVAPPRAAAARAIDPQLANVTISGVVSRSAVSKASIRGALNMSAINDCYRSSLRGGGVPNESVSADMTLTAGTSGGITSAVLTAPALPTGLRHCIEQVARRGRVRDVDTGEAQANITLAFAPR